MGQVLPHQPCHTLTPSVGPPGIYLSHPKAHTLLSSSPLSPAICLLPQLIPLSLGLQCSRCLIGKDTVSQVGIRPHWGVRIPGHVDVSEHEGPWETILSPHVVQLFGGRESPSLSLGSKPDF